MELSKEKIKEIVIECFKNIGQLSVDGSFDPLRLEEIHKRSIVNCIKSKFKQHSLNIILSEADLIEFHSIDELVQWCWEKQHKIKK